MTLSGLWTRKSSPKEHRQEPPPPSDVRGNPWAQLKSKLRPRRDHKAADRTTTPDAKVSAKTATHHSKRHLVLQIISPRPTVHPPRSSTTSSASRGNELAPTSAVYSSSYREVSQDSPFALLSQSEHMLVAPPGADELGVVPSTNFHARVVDLEENVGEPVEPPSSQQFPAVPSANTEITPLSDLDPPSVPESFNTSLLYGCKLASECLSAASMCQARRWRPRGQTNRARLIALDLSDSDFPLQNLDVLDLAVPAEAPPVALEGYESASGSFESADAPVPSDLGSNEAYSESVEYISPADVQVATQPPELHESAYTETMKFHPTSRDSVASSSSYYSLFEYEDIIPDRPMDAENVPPPFNPAEDTDVDSERSLYDPVLQCFFLPPKVSKLGSPTNYARKIDKEGIESAGVKAESLNADAPVPSTRLSGSESCKLVIRVTPPTPPVTMRPTYLHRNHSIYSGEVDLQDYLVPPSPRRSRSRASSDHSDLVSGEIALLAATRPGDNYSKVGRDSVERENDDVTAPVGSDTLFTPRHLRTIRTFGSSGTLVDQLHPSAEINILPTSGLAGDGFHVVDGEDVSAGDEAEPSSSDAPILSASVPRQKPREANGFASGFLPSQVHQNPRTLKLRIASSLRNWGNAVSRFFTAQRPANVGEAQNFSPYFDPWEQGYIPPRGPSPDLAQPGADFGSTQPSIHNVYVKLD